MSPIPKPPAPPPGARPAKPSPYTGSAELNAMIERIAPDIFKLLADGTPRTKAAISKRFQLLIVYRPVRM